MNPWILLLALGTMGALGAAQEQERRGSSAPSALIFEDRAEERILWERSWFGGRPSPAYLEQRLRQGAALQAREAQAQSAVPGALAAMVPAWRSLGPDRDTRDSFYNGRPNAILAHPTDPKTLYLATSGGGLWKTMNADPASAADWTWTPLTDQLPSPVGSLPIGAVAMSPTDPQTLWLGLGDGFEAEGRGFFYSQDGGASWQLGGSLGNTTRVLSILPLDGLRLLVGTNAGLWRSLDGGRTFSALIPDPGWGNAWIWELHRLGSRLVLSRQLTLLESEHSPLRSDAPPPNHVGEYQGPGDIWTSADEGLTWTRATLDSSVAALGLGRISLGVSPASATRAYGIGQQHQVVAQGLLSTADGGLSWTFQALSSATGLWSIGGDNQYNGWYNQLIAVDPADANELYVACTLGLYRSHNGGATWTPITGTATQQFRPHVDYHAATWSRTGPKRLYIANDGGLATLTDAAGSAQLDDTHNRGMSTHLATHLGSTLANGFRDLVSLGAQDNGSWIRRNQGSGLSTSTAYESQWGGDGFATKIHPKDGNRILVSAQFNAIGRSGDGGLSFLNSPTPAVPAPFHTRMALDPADPTGNGVYAAIAGGLIRSPDFGGTWSVETIPGLTTNLNQVRNLAVSPVAGVVAVVCGGSTGWRKKNGTWTPFGSFPSSAGTLSCITFAGNDPETLYVGGVALVGDAPHLWTSANGGTTWQVLGGPSSGFPQGIPVHDLATDPRDSRILFAGTDFGLYRSVDKGQSWAPYGTGLPRVATREIYLAPDASFVRVATYGRGVWEAPLNPLVNPFTISPSQMSLAPGASQAFQLSAATGSAPAVVWSSSGGSISAAGLFSAPIQPGTYTVTAIAVDDPAVTATATVVVQGGLVSRVDISPPNLALEGGANATFTATVTAAAGVSTAVSWGANGGSVSADGVFTAPLNGGIYGVTSTSLADPTKAATASVSVVGSPDLDRNGTLDVLDLALFAASYGSQSGQTPYRNAADLNGDGRVDEADLSLLLARLGI